MTTQFFSIRVMPGVEPGVAHDVPFPPLPDGCGWAPLGPIAFDPSDQSLIFRFVSCAAHEQSDVPSLLGDWTWSPG